MEASPCCGRNRQECHACELYVAFLRSHAVPHRIRIWLSNGVQLTGLIHIAGNDRLNRFAMVQQIADRLGYDLGLVVPTDPSGLPGRAPRPLDVSLDNSKARAVLDTPMRGLLDGLELVLSAREGGA